MTVIDSEERALWPLMSFVLFALRLHDVQNDRNSVFVVVADDALVRVCAITSHETVTFV